MDRTILHCDANNFFASVEVKNNPSLKGLPVAVSGNPEMRHGIILAKNEEAKKHNISTGEVIWSAKQKCPNLVLVPPNYDQYVLFSKKLFKLYSEYTDKVESFGIDECWLDITNSLKLFGGAEKIANEIKDRVQNEIGITISIGISFSKIFAKLGSDYKKPNAITVISKENYKNIAWPLPVSNLLMVGSKTNKLFKNLNIKTIGDLANTNPLHLKNELGIMANKLVKLANGIDDNPVVKYANSKIIPDSIGHSTTLKRDVENKDEAISVLGALSEMVYIRMLHYQVSGYGVSLTIKLSDLTSITRRKTFETPITSSISILENVNKLLTQNYSFSDKSLKIRGLGLSVFNLFSSTICIQNTIFDDTGKIEKRNKLENSLQDIRKKYGYNCIQNGIIYKQKDLCSHLVPQDFIAFKQITLDD